eukprot:1149480-Pelagomonas_calceolata.AAC.3
MQVAVFSHTLHLLNPSVAIWGPGINWNKALIRALIHSSTSMHGSNQQHMLHELVGCKTLGGNVCYSSSDQIN